MSIRRHPGLLAALAGLAAVIALGSFPARAYVEQQDQRRDLAERAVALAAGNQELGAQAEYLRSDEAIERLARQRYQLVRPGEEAYSIIPTGQPETAAEPTPVPAVAAAPAGDGWWSRLWSKITTIL